MPGSPAIAATGAPRRLLRHPAVPVLVGAVVLLRVLPGAVGATLVGVVLAAVVVAASRRPVDAAVALAALPFGTVLLATLYNLGVPAATIRAFGFWKEALAAGLVLAAADRLRRHRVRPALLDLAAAVLLGVGVVYALADLAPADVLDVGVEARLAALRTDLGPIVLVLALRHVGLDAAAVRRIHAAVLRTGLLLAGAAVVEFVVPSAWNQFAIHVFGILKHRIEVLGVDPDAASYFRDDVRVYGKAGTNYFFRLGSLEFDHLAFAFVLVVAIALAVERLVRSHRTEVAPDERRVRAWWLRVAPGDSDATAAVTLLVLTLVLNQTRSAAAVTALVLFAGTLALPGRVPATRRAVRRYLGAGLLLVLPMAAAVGLVQRVFDEPSSNSLHWESIDHAIHLLGDHPLGFGLGTGAGAGQAELGAAALVPENQLLQIGLQLGWLPMAAYAVLGAGAAAGLVQRARRGDGPAAAAGTALVALLVVGLLTIPFASLSVGWMTALVVGSALRSPADDNAPGRR